MFKTTPSQSVKSKRLAWLAYWQQPGRDNLVVTAHLSEQAARRIARDRKRHQTLVKLVERKEGPPMYRPTPAEIEGKLCLHSLYIRGLKGGARVDFSGSDLSKANLRGANLRGAKGIVSCGPVGNIGRIIYGVNHGDHVMVRAGCFWGDIEAFREAVLKKYPEGSKGRKQYLTCIPLLESVLEDANV